MRRIAGTLIRSLKGKGVRDIALALENAGHVAAAAEGALLGNWEPDKYKADPKKAQKQVDVFTIAVAGANADELETSLTRGLAIAEAQNLARDLVNEPANKLTPALLVEAAQQMATEQGLACEVLDREAMAKLGMGALLGVAQGSSNPPFLIAIKYRPSISSSSDHLALVGKGVTFDTGGISIKPSDGMEKMKYDMAGAAGVIGAMRAIALLKPAIPVTAYVPTVENMVNGDAQRPGDIVTAMSGKTIEVLNTDAEGRLIPRRRDHLRQTEWRNAFDRCGHPHRRYRRCTRSSQHRSIHQQRRSDEPLLCRIASGRGEDLAAAHG